jgi:tetratricopeptide (TPR) repeat protein
MDTLGHIASERFEVLRQLAARYWQPLVVFMAGMPVVLNVLKSLGVPVGEWPSVASTPTARYGLIGMGSLIFLLIRLPRIPVAVTRLILGAPKPPAKLPEIFRGPRAYSARDKDRLPGRQKEIDACWRDLEEETFFILEGESGCGKSSVLYAALIPLAQEKFRVIACRIAEDPFGKLYRALRDESYSRSDQPVTARDLAEAIARPPVHLPSNKPLLLCIDQFEELFVTVKDEVRRCFLNVLKEAIAGRKLCLAVVIRSDFRDLLDKACRDIDPKTLETGNYYELKAFSQGQAEAVLSEMLAPMHGNDVILKQQLEDFARALVGELLRPPRDKRLSPEDAKTVLPVELQMVGSMVEARGERYFSVTELQRLGGKAGLLRAYIEKAKNYVWHKTGVPGEQALLILRQLISPSQTKRGQTSQAIGETLGIPSRQVRDVLEAFAEQYLINSLPVDAAEGDAAARASAQQYELMHEHLAQILAEAPEPVLQKARDAEERLLFWTERTKGVPAPGTADQWSVFLARVKACFAMPIPLFESLRLWRYAPRGEERRMLQRNLRGFCLRLGALALPIAAWICWMHTDVYQMRKILAEAPVAQAASSSFYPYERTAAAWVQALIKADRLDEALTAARQMRGSNFQPDALAMVAEALIKTGRSDQAAKILDEALIAGRRFWIFDRARVFAVVADGLIRVGKADAARELWSEFLSAAQGIEDKGFRSRALTAVAEGLTMAGSPDEAKMRWDEAITTAREVENDNSRADALADVSQALARAGKADEALAVVREIHHDSKRHDVTVAIATALARAGKAEVAIGLAGEFDLGLHRRHSLDAIVKVLIKAGKAEAAITAARQHQETAYRSDSLAFIFSSAPLAAIATALAEAGEGSKALAVVRDIRDATRRADALVGVTQRLIRTARPEESAKLFDAALASAREIGINYDRARALAVVATALIEVGKVDEATKALQEALTTAQGVRLNESRPRALTAVAEGLTRVGKVDEATRALQEALTTAYGIEDNEDRFSALTAVSAGLAIVGNTQQAKQTLIDAFAAAHKISFRDTWSHPLKAIAEKVGKAGKAHVILAAAREIHDDDFRPGALIDVAQGLSKTDDADALIAAVSLLDHDSEQFRALKAGAQRLLKTGKAEAATKISRVALTVARQIKSDSGRSASLAEVAQWLARLQRYRRARLIANECSDSAHKLAAYTAIFIEYAKAKNPTLRQQLEAEQAEPEGEEDPETSI